MDVPTYVNCVFCPAQAYPLGTEQWVMISQSHGMTLQEYECPAHHKFYIKMENANAQFS